MNNLIRISTAADSKYFLALLNLIGTLLKTNSFQLTVYNLGLTDFQISLLKKLDNVATVKSLDSGYKHVSNPYAAKCIIWDDMSIGGGEQLFLDAGLMISGNLGHLRDEFGEAALLALPSSFSNSYCTPKSFFAKYSLDDRFRDKQELGSGFIYFDFDNPIAKKIVSFAKKMALDGDVEGWSEAEQHRNRGIASSSKVMDCYLFRHDETALNIAAYQYAKDIEPLSPMHVYNHCYKYEYNDQVVYTYRRRNRAPALKYVITSLPFASRWRLLPSILKNVFAYIYLTLRRNRDYVKLSQAYKKILEHADSKLCKRLLVFSTLDRKYSYKTQKTEFAINEQSDNRWFRFDTFSSLMHPSEAEGKHIIDASYVTKETLKKGDVVVVDSVNISMSLISILSQYGLVFFIRFKALSVDDAYYQSSKLMSVLKEKYYIYNAEMSDVIEIYDYAGFFDIHPRENSYQPMFHDREVVELLFTPKDLDCRSNNS